MSEKFLSPESATDVPMSEIIELAEAGFADKAMLLATIKLETFTAILREIQMVLGEHGVIPKADWEKEASFFQEQIVEIDAFLRKYKS
jgi:hypothetical protein